MHDYKLQRRLLQPRRVGFKVKLFAVLALVADFLKFLMILGFVTGVGVMAYSIYELNHGVAFMVAGKNAFIGLLVVIAGGLMAIPALLILNGIEPTTQNKADGAVLYAHWKKLKTVVIKENLIAEVKKVGRLDEKRGTRMVRLNPIKLGQYVDWEIDLPDNIAKHIQPGWFIRQRVIYYRFPFFGEYDYKYSHKVIIHDDKEVVRGVIELHGGGKWKITKEVAV